MSARREVSLANAFSAKLKSKCAGSGVRRVPTRSYIGLNAANFLQAEMVGVILPVMSAFLRENKWSYSRIGLATAIGGLGTLVFQAPAGWLTDRFSWRRMLFFVVAVVTGACFFALPLAPQTPGWVDSLLFVAGATQSFFGPVLGALALGLAGYAGMNRMMGANQGWNHAGNIASALLGMGLVSALGLKSIFFFVGMSSLLAGASVLLIRERDIDEAQATGLGNGGKRNQSWTTLLKTPAVLALFISILLFHLANAPILPTVALYVKKLGGSDNLMTATVLTAQLVMVPVALLTGRLCNSWGRKAIMGVAFWVLPVRILSYSFVNQPGAIVALQALDGIGAGIYGVAVAAFSADLTQGKGGFNTLMGLFATALAIGGVVGPLVSGLLVDHLGFHVTFWAFAGLAMAGAVIFEVFVRETRKNEWK